MKLNQQIQNSDTAEIRLLVPCGSMNEKEGEFGISHIVEHMNLAFVKNKKYAEVISGCTTYEYTEYRIGCSNRYKEVYEALELLLSIIEGRQLNKDNLPYVKEDILCEVTQHKENPYFCLRNLLFSNILPENIRNTLPVGKKEDIETISFDKIQRYFTYNYSYFGSAIFLSSGYDFSKMLKNDGECNVIKEYPDSFLKHELKWTVNQLYYERDKKVYSVYFIRNASIRTAEEYALQELEIYYFLTEFDTLLQKKVEEYIDAAVYENRIIRNLTIFTYEIQLDETESLNDIDLKKIVRSVLREMHFNLVVDRDKLQKTGDLLYNKFRNTNFFDKCRMDYLYGINYENFTEKFVHELCSTMSYGNIGEIIEKCVEI